MAFNLTPVQESVLLEFQKRLKDQIPTEMCNDTILLTKFLRARDFNIKDAESMINKNVRWRKEMQLDTILTDFRPPEVFRKYISIQIIGFTKDGYPLRYIQLGNNDSRGLLKSTNSLDIIKSIAQKATEDLYLQASQSEKLGKQIAQTVGIYDAANISLALISHIEAVQLLMRLITMLQDNFPEIVKHIFIINASVYFTSIWPVVQKCMASELIKKISIHGQNGWKEELLKTIDADTLPAFLGGNRTDPDGNPLCLTIVNHLTGRIPEKYYLEKNVKQFARKPGVKLVKIDRQGKTSESIEITGLNSIINWEFLIKSHDVGFGILLETKDESSEELIPVHKIWTEYDPYVGKYKCKKQGNHLIVIDNSYSWLYSKEVYYRIWITSSEEDNIETICI